MPTAANLPDTDPATRAFAREVFSQPQSSVAFDSTTDSLAATRTRAACRLASGLVAMASAPSLTRVVRLA